VCEISFVEKFCSRKSRPKFTLGHQIYQQSIDRTSFYRHTVVTLALDCLVWEISLVLYLICHFWTYPLSFTKIWRRFSRTRWMSSVVKWARSLG